MAQLGPNYVLYSNLTYETPLTDDKWPSSSKNVRTIGTIPLLMATNIIILTWFLSFVSQIFRGFSFAYPPSFFRWGFWWRQKTSRQSEWFYRECWMVAAESTDKTAFSELCGHQLMIELKCNDKNGVEELV